MTRKDQTGKAPPSQSLLKLSAAAVLFTAIMGAVLMMPAYPSGFSSAWYLRFPLEVPLTALVLLVLPRRPAHWFALLLTAILALLLFLKLADIGVQSAFQRPFNPYLDVTLLKNGWIFLSGTFGAAQTAAALSLAGAAFAVAILAFWKAETWLVQSSASGRKLLQLAFASGGLLTGLLMAAPQTGLPDATFRAASDLGQRLSQIIRSYSDLRSFEADLATAKAPLVDDALFSKIKGRDVILVFIESYGRSAIEAPLFRPLIVPRLQQIEKTLKNAGFSSASVWSGSPTVAGLSWLAHGTLLSGLWIDNQARYDRLMGSQHPSLNRLFAESGWRTSAVMPAITMDWPEANYFGYDQVLTASDLEYRGKPFNWVTMPDQYTLSAFERLARQPARTSGMPVMAEIALISSHAPWTPVPQLLSWDLVGDGTVFNRQAESGETPEVVWADPVKIRDHYIHTIDYSLETLGSYIERFGGDAVFIVLGDHQPAALVTGPNASRAVPVHVISRDQTLMDRLRAEGFQPGMLPGKETPDIRMDDLREVLIRSFSGANPQVQGPHN